MRRVEAHKTIAATAGLIVAVGLVAYFLVLYPKVKANQALKERADKLETELREDVERGWELSPGYLNELKRLYGIHRGESLEKLLDVLANANSEFKQMIDPYNSGVKLYDWQIGVTLFEYQEKFEAVKRNLAGQGIYLNEQALGMSVDTSMPEDQLQYTYRLLAKMHVVERLALLCKKHGLQLADSDWKPKKPPADWTPDTARPPAMIKALQTRAYAVDPAEGEETKVFVEEFPIQIKVNGHINDLCGLLANLTEEGYFLPLDRIVLHSTGIDHFRRPGFGYRTHERIEATLTCSGFLVMMDIAELQNAKAEVSLKKVKKKKRRGGE